MRYLAFLLTTMISTLAIAQQGTIRGKVLDDKTGEELIGVTVLIKNTSNGATTDLDGEFSIDVAAGSYDLQISYVSYQTILIENIQVNSGEVNRLNNIRLNESTLELQEVVVTAEVIRNTEQALHTVKRKSPAILDGISADKIQLTGDANAVQAAKRITGVSIEGGKYVYVRGLGDRYSKTMLDNVDIPGLDPDRNTIQMDLFPTSLIENIMVSKNFTADMQADFTGGMLNIQTKDFPEEKIFNISIGTSYNPDMNLISDFLSYPGGSTDWLGYDDGTRALPAGARQEDIPSPINPATGDQDVNNFVNSFNPQLSANRGSNFLNYNASLSFGDQISLGRTPKLGYIFSLSYRNDYTYYNDVFYGEYQRIPSSEVYDLRYSTIQSGQLGETNTMLGALAGVAFKTQFTKIRFTGMRLQNGESRAGNFTIDNNGEAVGQSGYIAASNNLEYNQRAITNLLLNGTHVLGKSGWEIDWRMSPTFSSLEDPDIRKTAFTLPINGEPTFNAGAGGNPTRIWRNLEELNAVAKLDITKKYRFKGEEAKFKIGGIHTYKERDYEILSFDAQFWGGQPNWSDTDPAQVLQEENIYPQGPIYYSSGNPVPNPNAYQSNANNSGAYISNELNLFPKLKTILGLRAENFVLRHTGRDQAFAQGNENGRNLEDEIVLESLDLFPSVNLIYNITEPQNLRFSYTKTIARPSFKEMSFAQILDPITNRIFNGGLFPYSDWDGNLTETRIDNLDLRWEYFLEGGQIFSVSAFYKTFDRPIELVRIPQQQTSVEFQPRNVGDGVLYGAELEFAKSLDFISPAFRFFNISTNLTLIHSQIDMTDREFNSRMDFLKDGQTISKTRQMAGQSPFVINSGITYSNFDNGIETGFFYNVKGPTLELVCVGLYPDVYTQPFHSLNFSFNKRLGANQNTTIDFKISNLLNDKIESYYEAYNTQSQIFSSINPGRAISLGISHNF